MVLRMRHDIIIDLEHGLTAFSLAEMLIIGTLFALIVHDQHFEPLTSSFSFSITLSVCDPDTTQPSCWPFLRCLCPCASFRLNTFMAILFMDSFSGQIQQMVEFNYFFNGSIFKYAFEMNWYDCGSCSPVALTSLWFCYLTIICCHV